MEIEVPLSRVDYAQVGTTSKGCLRLLGSVDKAGKKGLDKIVVGSHSGVLLCLTRKDADTQIVFKTLPGPKIQCVQLGGAIGTVLDKTFISADNTIRGFSKKGKQFFQFEMNVTESINAMFIYGVEMLICARNIFNHYHDCADANHYICNERICDVLCLPITEGSWVGRGLTPVLACEDKTIKILDGSIISYQIEIGDVPNVLHLFLNDGGRQRRMVLYGTKEGRLGLADLPTGRGSIIWEISTRSSSAITTIHCHPISGFPIPDVLLGKEDGLIEIYNIDDQDRPTFKQSFQCEESITGLQCGRIASPNYDEIIVCTYTGWLFALTTEPTGPQVTDGVKAPTLTPQMEIKVQQMRTELEELEVKVNEERTKYQDMTMKDDNLKTTVPHFTVNDRFTLNKELALYSLTIELIVPIDYILLQSDVILDLIDVDRNSAVVSLTQCEPGSGNALLATYRCQANTTRIELRMRSVEEHCGTVRAYITPKIHPKMCQLRSYQMKPLSLHTRAHNFDQSRPSNELKLVGSFTLADAHNWLQICLSDVPDRPPPQDKVIYNFSNCFNGGTQLQANYSKGNALFRSDNVSTIAILKDVLGKEITDKQIKVNMECNLNEQSIPHALQLLHPKLEYQVNLTKKYQIAEALKELEASEGDLGFLSPELRDLLGKYEQIRGEVGDSAALLDRLFGIITDLYIDKHKLLGKVAQRREELDRLLFAYNLSDLLSFFEGN